MQDNRLIRQLEFLTEVDQLKSILRASRLADNSRHENSAEHSWHVILCALVLADQAGPDVSIDRVIRMLILHDIVEIDAGDAPIHGTHDAEALAAAEMAAAERLFNILPADQATQMRALWDEFEAAESADAIFAKSIDRVQPLLLNLANGGGSWIDYNVSEAQIATRVGSKVAKGAPRLWEHMRARIAAFFAGSDAP